MEIGEFPFLLFSGERPPSSMAPSVLKSPSKILLIGATGGTMITTAIASVRIRDNRSKHHQSVAEERSR